MYPFVAPIATLAVSTIYLLWHNYRLLQDRQQRVRRDRVAFLLWMAAQHAD